MYASLRLPTATQNVARKYSYLARSRTWRSIRATVDELDVPTSVVQTAQDKKAVVASAKEFLQVELDRLFKTGILTRARYSDTISFVDPVSKLDNLSAYQFSLQLLQLLFNVDCTIHAVEATGDDEVTARFSMTLEAKGVARPQVVITGRSVFKVDLDSGKIISHADTWDALQNNDFLSPEALSYLLSQAMESVFMVTPDLETPPYSVLKKTADYELRRYSKFLVAETGMGASRPSGSGSTSSNEYAAVAGGNGFNELAGYIFGGNTTSAKMEMTTPVFTATTPGQQESVMQFVIEDKYANDANLPEPNNPKVSTHEEGGGYWAAIKFGGFALEWEVAQNEQRLRQALQAAGLQPRAGFRLARYNEPFVPPFLRRNEVLIELEGFTWP